MIEPAAAGGPSPAVGVLVPVKAFSASKHRLAPVLDDADRAALATALATRVVAAASGLDVWVVCDDEPVARWAEGVGAAVIWSPAKGLNAAVTDGVATLAAQGVERVVVAHADLPLAHDLRPLADFPGVTLVPDRRDDGTNVIALPAGAGFAFAYGPGSFTRHQRQAERLGLPTRVLRDRELGFDLDTPDDVADLTRLTGVDLLRSPTGPLPDPVALPVEAR